MSKNETWRDLEALLHLGIDDDLHDLVQVLREARGTTLLAEAQQPPRLLYVQDHVTHQEIKTIDLPGVRIEEPPPQRQFYEMHGPGLYHLIGNDDDRLWLEQLEDGSTIPLGSRPLLAWARALAGERIPAGVRY